MEKRWHYTTEKFPGIISLESNHERKFEFQDNVYSS